MDNAKQDIWSEKLDSMVMTLGNVPPGSPGSEHRITPGIPFTLGSMGGAPPRWCCELPGGTCLREPSRTVTLGGS